MTQPIYFDNNSTTQIDPVVLNEMLPYFSSLYGNASSSHSLGQESKKAVNKSRLQLSELLYCSENEIIFTSGATESINLCLQVVVRNAPSNPAHIITLKTEHPAVLDTCKWLESNGTKVSYLGVASDGILNLEELKSEITPQTILICIMFSNNETGVIQSIKEISEIAHNNGILFMCDATQAVGKLPINVYDFGIDLLCFSGHKFYAPKGIGGLFIRSKRPFKPKMSPIIHGGGQEKTIRSGTLNIPGIVGIGKAAEISNLQMLDEANRIEKMRNFLEEELLKIPASQINGNVSSRIFTTTNIQFSGVDADAIISGLKDIAISNGSACSSNSIEPSHVLIAMGLTPKDAFSSIRFSLGRFNTIKEIQHAVISFKYIIEKLRKFSKSYD